MGKGQKTLTAVWGNACRGRKSGSRKTSSKAMVTIWVGNAYSLSKDGSNPIGK